MTHATKHVDKDSHVPKKKVLLEFVCRVHGFKAYAKTNEMPMFVCPHFVRSTVSKHLANALRPLNAQL